MADANQQVPNAEQRGALLRVISEPRFASYLKAAGHDWDKAWKLYIWNAKMGEAFHLPIQTTEVALRNSLCAVFTGRFGPNWATSSSFEAIIDAKLQGDLDVVKNRIARMGKKLENGQVVASLSFGFWVGLLHRRYFPPIWSSDLATAFPQLPNGIDHRSVYTRFSHIAILRNRISHHEPLIKLNISDEYSKIMVALGWMCPHTRGLIKAHSRVPQVMRERP